MSMAAFEADAANILKWAEVITGVASVTPSPIAPFAATALIIENMLSGLLQTQTAITGKTAAEIYATLVPDIKPIP